jgi:hypothetical protein
LAFDQLDNQSKEAANAESNNWDVKIKNGIQTGKFSLR